MIEVFEGPLCCNTGVCGPNPEQALVDFTADLAWLSRQGIQVRRANLAQDPIAFAESEVARSFVQKVGAEGLPLIIADGVTVSTGRYPTRTELARFAGASGPAAVSKDSCCGDSSSTTCCSPTQSVSIGNLPAGESI